MDTPRRTREISSIRNDNHSGRAAVRLDSTPHRTCIVTRKSLPKNKLWRFVIDPEQRIVPDPFHKLPGRGLYTLADRHVLEKAIHRKVFDRVVRQTIMVPEDIISDLYAILHGSALQNLSLARRSGALIASAEKIEKYAKNNILGVYITASKPDSDNRRKLTQMCNPAICVDIFTNQELSQTLGFDNAMHLALKPGGICKKFLTIHQNLLNLSQMKE